MMGWLRSLGVVDLLGYDFFISYSRSDSSSYARQLVEELRNRGYSSFLDTSELAPGQGLNRSLARALLRTSVLVVVGSEGGYEQNAW